MPRKNSFAICLFSLVAGFGAPLYVKAQTLDVMPAPSEFSLKGGRVPAFADLEFSGKAPLGDRLRLAAVRAAARWHARLGASAPAGAVHVILECRGRAPAIPTEGVDESYTLTVSADGIVLSSPNDIGAIRGLETLLQLASRGADGWSMPAVTVNDTPRFAWRGLMIDVARHWQPIGVIERNIDAMAVVKLNVLHLHLTDDQGFRIESKSHPELQEKGSDGKFFTQEEMKSIIAYAAGRGIRVVPEFDVPGHATSWVVSHPELASLPGPYGIERHWGVFNPVLDPTQEATYALLGDFLREMAALFPDRFIHIGGDENNGVQWNANPKIQAFIRDHGLKGNEGLHAYFNKRIEAILTGQGKRVVGWDEILNPELPRDCVIDSWRGPEGVAAATALGFDCILSNGYYIDLIYPASDHYLADPIPPGSPMTSAQRSHVLGGEATMWSEWVTPETIDSRIWPRTAAIAERLWSPQSVRDVDDMYRRLAIVDEFLGGAGARDVKNRDVMLRHLVGENLSAPGVSSLRTLIGLLEPVKHYRRGGLQVWSNQLIPLIGLADAAAPESVQARRFALQTDQALFSAHQVDASSAGRLLAAFGAWEAAAKAIGPLADTDPGVREALPAARALGVAAEEGAAAARSLSDGKPLGEPAFAAALAALDKAAAPEGSATELPVLAPVRLLVAAARLQAERPKLTDEAWRKLVTSRAFPDGPGRSDK